MKKFIVRLGFGPLPTQYPKEIKVIAIDAASAQKIARRKYYEEVESEIGKNQPILGMILTLISCQEVPR